MKNDWKRFNNYEKSITAFFMLNIFLDVVNKKLLNSIIPVEIIGYLFWLSLGLFLGFRWCKYEFTRVWNKMQVEQEKKDQEKKDQSL